MENETEKVLEKTTNSAEDFSSIPIKPTTKERLYKMKNMSESWDELLNRLIPDKVVEDGRI